MAFAGATRLARQRAGRDLVHQDIDYSALGVPIIFPDGFLAPDVEPDRRLPRQERLATTVMTPILALHMALTGDGDWFGGMPLDIYDNTEIPRSALDIKRENLLLGVIREIDGEFAAEDMEVGGLDVLDAFQLISQAGEAPVGNVCDPNYTMLAKVGKQYLGSPDAYDGSHARLREAGRYRSTR
jgi:hypothetical protein